MKEIATVLPKEGVNVRASLDPVEGPGPKIGAALKHGTQIEVGERKGTHSLWWRKITYNGRPDLWIAECRKDGKAVYLSIEQIPDAPRHEIFPPAPPPADEVHEDDRSPPFAPYRPVARDDSHLFFISSMAVMLGAIAVAWFWWWLAS